MKWTKETPKEPGVYFAEDKKGNIEGVLIEKDDYSPDGIYFYFFNYECEERYKYAKETYVKWYGPIEPPDDEDEDIVERLKISIAQTNGILEVIARPGTTAEESRKLAMNRLGITRKPL